MCSCSFNAASFVVQFGVSAGVRRKDFLVYTGSSVIAEQPQTSGFALCGPHPEWILGYVYLSRERSRGCIAPIISRCG